MAIDARKIEAVQLSENTSLGSNWQQWRLERAFWIACAGLAIVAILTTSPASAESGLGALFIAFAALLPSYFWCTGRVTGMPVYPIYCLTFLWTYALPLASEHPLVITYSPASHLSAASIITGFLLLGAFVWFWASNYNFPAIASYRVLTAEFGNQFFFGSLVAYILFLMASTAGRIEIEAGIFSVIRATLSGASALGTFVLSYKWGKGKLSNREIILLCILLFSVIITSIASLLLVGALSLIGFAGIAYVLGRGRIPWGPLLGILLSVGVLHYGKATVRNQYLFNDETREAIQPWQYPTLVAEWVSYSFDYLFNPNSTQLTDPQPLSQRASLVHLFLMVQDKSPGEIPYMMGSTYQIIPELLVPRFLLPDKVASHEGTYLLNIQYGLQTREATAQTTIGWGLLNEAFANFGIYGCIILAVILGGAYGFLSSWTVRAPVLSARFLLSALILSFAFQTEFSASVFITALFQSLVPLMIISLLLMKSAPVMQETR